MRRYLKISTALVVIAISGTWIGLAQQRRQVDEALLKTGSKTGDEWISYGGNWSEQRYSAMDQINASNVSRLGLAWSTEIPLAPGTPSQTHQENTPLVFNGVLYGITPWSIAYAVDLKTHKEVWRAAGGGAGAFAGGALATAGNLVFSSVNSKLIAFRADNGDKAFEIDLGTTQMGPPISFTIDGTQYIAVTAGLAAAAGAAPTRAPQLFVLGLDGKAPLPGAQN